MKSADLEKKAREEREQLERSVDDLNQGLSPGRLLDDYYFHGEGFTGYLRHLREDPIPGALVGAAIAWSSSREQIKHAASGVGDKAKSGVSGAKHKISETRDSVRSKKGEASGRAAAAKDAAGAKAGQARDYAAEKAGEFRARSGQAAEEADRTLREHPLMSMAVGFSLGAALGGLTPISKAEKEAVGTAASRARKTADSVGHDRGSMV